MQDAGNKICMEKLRRQGRGMKLAIVHDWLTGMRGGEKCLEVLCRAFPEAKLFTLLHAPGSTSEAIERMDIQTSFLQRVPGIARRYRYLLPLMPAAIQRLRLPSEIDLVLSLSHAVAKSIVPPAGVPHVCYCFTPMRYAWHLRSEYFDDPARASVASGRIRAPIAVARNLVLDRLRHWDRETAHRVNQFIAISRTVAERIAQCYGRDSEVIYPPVDTDFYTPNETERSDYYLCVSALVPYKRIDLAIQSCARLKRRLVIIGQGPDQRRLEELGNEHVTWLGWQPNEIIRDHLRRCRALLFPGHEDFGIVPVEAQACGTPIVALARGGALETVLPAAAGQIGTGRFFCEPTVQSLCEAMLWLEDNQDRLSPSLSRQQAERFATHHYQTRLIDRLTRIAAESGLQTRPRLANSSRAA